MLRCGRMAHPCPISTEVRTQPCCLQDGREQAHRAPRITTCFRSSWPAFFTTSESLSQCSDGRCESFVSACKVQIKIVNCATAEVHEKDQETHATAICFVYQVNFPMLLKLRVVPGSINSPLWLKTCDHVSVMLASNTLYRVVVLQMKWT